MTVLQLDEVTIVARNRNIPERAGKVNLDFVVTVPGRLIDDKWQVQLTPVAYKRGRRIELERIFLSGADFVKRQKKGYAQYRAFINSIIPDSAYLKEMFDMKGYRRAMAELEEEFYRHGSMTISPARNGLTGLRDGTAVTSTSTRRWNGTAWPSPATTPSCPYFPLTGSAVIWTPR